MKKSVLLVAALLFSLPLFADSKNIVYNESFEFSQIDSLEILLSYENLKISQIYGDEIVVEIGSNNIKKIPEVTLEQDELYSTLKISTTAKKVLLGTNCTVYLYLPQDFLADQMSISLVSGNLQADILRSQNALFVNNISGRTDISESTTEYLKASSVSGNIKIQKLSASYFEMDSISGNIFIELEKAMEAKSRITSVSGKIQVYYKKNESPFSDDSPDFIISSVSGKTETIAY